MSGWHTEETYKGLLQLAVGGLRFGALVNGGAAIALLAFIGDIYGRDVFVPSLQGAMNSFVFGIALSGLAHVSAYFTQLRLYRESAGLARASGGLQHAVFLYLSMLCVLGSIALFCWGAYSATSIVIRASQVT